MRRRAFLGLAGASAANGAAAVDFVPFAPALEQVSSPDGHFVLDIATEPRNPNGRASGTMRRDGAMVWRRVLAAPVRPRYALVADDGRAVLIGCWQNIPADATIEILGPDGAVRWRLERAAIEQAAGATAAAIAAAAKHGTWLDRMPRLEGTRAMLGAAGRGFGVDLVSGEVK